MLQIGLFPNFYKVSLSKINSQNLCDLSTDESIRFILTPNLTIIYSKLFEKSASGTPRRQVAHSILFISNRETPRSSFGHRHYVCNISFLLALHEKHVSLSQI
jgi:hypothetical protein